MKKKNSKCVFCYCYTSRTKIKQCSLTVISHRNFLNQNKISQTIFFNEDIEEKLLRSRHYTKAGITQNDWKNERFYIKELAAAAEKQEAPGNLRPSRHVSNSKNVILETKDSPQLLILHISFDINHGLLSLGRTRAPSANFGTEHRAAYTSVCLRHYEFRTCAVARSAFATIGFASGKSG